MLGQRLVDFYNVGTVSKVPTAVLGGIPNIEKLLATKASHRVAYYNLKALGEHTSFDAEGFWLVLSYYLESICDVLVYRLIGFKDIQEDSTSFDGLDNNYSVKATLEPYKQAWQLHITLDAAAHALHETTLDVIVPTLGALWEKLPELAQTIAQTLTLPTRDNSTSAATAAWSQEALAQLKTWQRLLAQYFATEVWDDIQAYACYQAIQAEQTRLGEAWQPTLIALFSVVYHPEFASFSLEIRQALEKWQLTVPSALFLADKRYKAGQAHEAVATLQNSLMTYTYSEAEQMLLTAKAVQLQLLSGRWHDAFALCQASIEEDLADASVLASYAQVLATLVANQIPIQRLVLANEVDEEITEAYRLSLEKRRDSGVLLRLLEHLAVLGDDEAFVSAFEQVFSVQDETTILEAVELLEHFESSDALVERLIEASEAYPDKPHYAVALAKAYLLNGEVEEAAILIKQLEADERVGYQEELEHLRLKIRWEDFDYWFGEFVTQIDANNPLNDRQLELLEEVIEVAPSYAEAYIALAKAYRLIEDDESALEVITDAQTHVQHPALWSLGAEILWDSGDISLGINYLLKGIEMYPDNVALLAQMGKFMFDADQREEARAYLARAEALATTNHPDLQVVRRYIASQMGQDEV